MKIPPVMHIVNFSGGLCSFWASHRLIERHGKHCVKNVFADTLIEDADLYEFNEQAAKILGVPITRISKELTPWQLFRREGLIGNDRYPICSTKLKREPLNDWMESHFEMDNRYQNMHLQRGAVVLGFDWTEEHRVQAFQAQHPNWTVFAPMTEPPIWSKCKMQTEAEKLGLKISHLYELGFPHNNCGGACVRAGISHWVHLYRTLPKRFLLWEQEEQDTLADFAQRGVSNGHFAILKDRRGGKTKPLYLKDLRLRIEAGEEFPKHEWGGCGCGGADLFPET